MCFARADPVLVVVYDSNLCCVVSLSEANTHTVLSVHVSPAAGSKSVLAAFVTAVPSPSTGRCLCANATTMAEGAATKFLQNAKLRKIWGCAV